MISRNRSMSGRLFCLMSSAFLVLHAAAASLWIWHPWAGRMDHQAHGVHEDHKERIKRSQTKDKDRHTNASFFFVFSLFSLCGLWGLRDLGDSPCAAASAPTAPAAASPPPRRTWLVNLFETVRQSVVLVETVEDLSPPPPPAAPAPPASQPGTRPATQPATRPATRPATPRPPGETRTHWGTGVLIHPDGYILTNSHCFRYDGRRRAICSDGRARDVVVLADEPDFDLALARVTSRRPFAPMKLGRSSDLMVGEQAVTLGNPFGMGLTLSLGIITALNRGTNTGYANLSGMIMTEASSNPGTSGGPLLNVNSELIGIVTSRKTEGDNLGFAIPVDTAWRVLPEMLSEGRLGHGLGLKVTAGPGEIKVEQVFKGSPAEAAGVRPGDVIVGVGAQEIRNGVEGLVALAGLKSGQATALRLRREDKIVEVQAAATAVQPRAAQSPEPRLQAGLVYEWFKGKWAKLPDVSSLKPAGSGTMETITLAGLAGKRELALRASGYLKVPQDGVYTFWLSSHDGSRLQVGSALVVDNDGTGTRTARGHIALKAGGHPITVTYFSAAGEPSLAAYWECPGQPRRAIPAAALFRGLATSEPAEIKVPRKVVRGLW